MVLKSFIGRKMILLLVLTAFSDARFLPGYFNSTELGEVICYAFECKSIDIAFDLGECQRYQGVTYWLQPCPSDQTNNYCPITEQGGSVYCTAPPDPTPQYVSYPGEPCVEQVDWVIGFCDQISQVCVGKSSGQQCVNHMECEPGLRCADVVVTDGTRVSICTQQIRIGYEGCKTDEDCSTRAACNVTESDGTGKWVPYFSFDVGSYVSDCDTHFQLSDICSSGWCTKDTVFDLGGQCIEAPVSNQPIPTVCREDLDCTAQSGSTIYQGKCECGFSDAGVGYCHSFVGDEPGLEYIQAFKYFVASNQLSGCNTARRFNPACWETSNGQTAFNFKKKRLEFQKYPQLVGNDACVKRTWTAFYWLLDATMLSLTMAILIMG